ncbi:hypothetical protein KHA80_21135 [Anaerobacillus sp. HL2]|nr:hypothetical protein KHA80_21135 [Anaerobacillus sp. HL2]
MAAGYGMKLWSQSCEIIRTDIDHKMVDLSLNMPKKQVDDVYQLTECK